MKTLTPEQLDLLKRSQPKIKMAMGEWQFADNGITVYRGEQTLFTVFMRYDDTLCTITKNYGKVNFIPTDENIFRVPKTIDWQNPERGLWGMILGTKELSENWSACLLTVTTEHRQKTYSSPDPFTALLKALAEQEGV